MKKNIVRSVVSCVLFSLLTACSSTMPPASPSGKEAMPTKEERMQMWEKAGTPGDNHKLLSSWVGKWKTEVTTWMPGSDKPLKTSGHAVVSSIMGGRFVEEKYFGSFHGKVFEGRGIYGFDNTKAEFTSAWFDNTGTSVMISKGTMTDGSISWSSNYTCPITKQGKNAKAITKVINAKEHVFEMWDTNEEGKDVKIFEIKYTKK